MQYNYTLKNWTECYFKILKHQKVKKPRRECQMNTWRTWEAQELSLGYPEVSADSEETTVKQNCSFSSLRKSEDGSLCSPKTKIKIVLTLGWAITLPLG